MIDAFVSYIEKKDYTQKTKAGYQKDIEQFLSYCREREMDVLTLQKMEVQRFLFSLKEQGASNHTIARKTSALRLFFRYLRETGSMVHHPMDGIKQPVLKARPTQVREEDITRLEEHISSCGKVRDLLLFRLLREGVSLREAVGIHKSDVDLTQSILYLPKKACPLSMVALNLFRVVTEPLDPVDHVFQTERKNPLTSSGAYYLLKQYIDTLGLQLAPRDMLGK